MPAHLQVEDKGWVHLRGKSEPVNLYTLALAG